jgi:CheY-like chemotaxis protein
MEKIFTVGFSQESAINLSITNIDLPNLVDNDNEYHNFIIKLFTDNEIDKLIFDLSSKPIQSLKLAYHIRLSLNDLKEKALIPILFSSTLSFESILGNCGKWIQIFATKGIYFTSYNLVKIEIPHIEPLKAIDYKQSFLDSIQILPDEADGKHSIANQWGAFAIDKASNTNVLYHNNNLKQTFNKLYFKYILAFQYDYSSLDKKSHIIGNIPLGTANTIESKNRKILLIDDEAEKGWELVLKRVFANADFQVIKEKIADYNSFSDNAKKLITEGGFDLFLVDLRLNGVQEEDFTPIEKFSGTNVLTEIKNQNKGNQVIIFTASNKAWNIKPLLDFRADAFYVKESPEYMFSPKVSESNYLTFKTNVETCFERSYLKNIYSKIFELKNKLKVLNHLYDQKFLDEIKILLDQSFDMHYNAKDDKQFAYAYVTLYMIIELINNQFVAKLSSDKWGISGNENLLDWKWNDNKYSNTNTEITGNKPPEWQKIAGLYFQKWNKTDNNFIQNIYFLIKMRNGFVHNDMPILNRKGHTGKYINHDIFNKEGYLSLFNSISVLLNLL